MRDRSEGVRIATWNVHKCRGKAGFSPSTTAEAISRISADLVVLQEVDQRFGLEKGRGLLCRTHLSRLELEPIAVSVHQDGLGWHGNAVLLSPELKVCRVDRIRLPGLEPRGAVSVELRRVTSDTPEFRIIGVHLGLLAASRRKQIEALLSWIDRQEHLPTVVAGDTNEWRKSGSLARLLHRSGSAINAGASFPSQRPLFGLDRVIGLLGAEVTAPQVLDDEHFAEASDHLPVIAELHLGAAVRAPVPTLLAMAD